MFASHVPAVGWLRSYPRSWLGRDAVAGLTTAAVVIPQAMAYATIAGLPVQVGLYTAVVPLLVYALLGTSRPLSVSTTSTIAALTAVAVAGAADGDPDRALAAASTLAVLAGVLLLAAGALGLGFLADFISLPVLAGFKAGTGLLIAAGQLGKLLGIPQEGDDFFEKTRSAIEHLDAIQWTTAALAGATIVLLLALRRWAPRSVPAALIAVAAGILLARAADLDDEGVALVGSIPAGLPSFAAPDIDLIGPLLPAAAGVALMSFVESIAAARAFVREEEPDVDADRELRAIGVANICGGLFQSLPAGGGLSQTAVNDSAGARTPLAGALTGAVAALTLLFLTGLFADLPQATLGALVLVSAIGLVDLDALRRIRAIRETGFLLGLVTLVAVLALGVLDGVLVGVVASMLTLVHALNHPVLPTLGRMPGTEIWRELDRHPDGETVSGALVVRIGGALYFANVQRVRGQLLELVSGSAEPPRILVIDMSAVSDIDVTALAILPAFDRELRDRGVTLSLASANERPLELLRRSPGYADMSERIFLGPDAAIAALTPRRGAAAGDAFDAGRSRALP